MGRPYGRRGSFRHIQIFFVVDPMDGIGFDIKMNAFVFVVIPNDMFIIIALPNIGHAAVSLDDFARDGRFILTNDRTQ